MCPSITWKEPSDMVPCITPLSVNNNWAFSDTLCSLLSGAVRTTTIIKHGELSKNSGRLKLLHFVRKLFILDVIRGPCYVSEYWWFLLWIFETVFLRASVDAWFYNFHQMQIAAQEWHSTKLGQFCTPSAMLFKKDSSLPSDVTVLIISNIVEEKIHWYDTIISKGNQLF